jgi:hypothetical protein
MAGHAGFGRRQSREAGLFHRSVTVTAIKAQAADMVFVTKGHRLTSGYVLIRDVR